MHGCTKVPSITRESKRKSTYIGNSMEPGSDQDENVQDLLFNQITCSIERFNQATIPDAEIRYQSEIPTTSAHSRRVHLKNSYASPYYIFLSTTAFMSMLRGYFY